MYKLILALAILMVFALADNNNTDDNKTVTDVNITKDVKDNIQKEIEAEKKFAKEQKFYQGEDYNLTEHEVDEKALDKVPLIEPEYDFDITDLYSD